MNPNKEVLKNNKCQYCWPKGRLSFQKKTKKGKDFPHLLCDFCGAKYCVECNGTFNVMGHTSKYKFRCKCDNREDKIEEWILLTEEINSEEIK
jgi:hypothetical protein